jgi:tetratricopeptide (TPR) repeat protein
MDALRDGADVLQYSGHATFELNDEGNLILEDPDNKSDYYPAAQLAQLLSDAGVRLVVLSACDTGRRNGRSVWSGVAPALTREKVLAVIANQLDILDSSAIVLAARIYPRLLSGYAIDEALMEARQAMYQQRDGLQNRDWGAPVLYLHDESGVLFPSLTHAAAGEGRPPARQAPLQMSPPVERTVLLGRDEELSLAQAKLREGGKVYYHGTYGVGKTTLAAELYRRAGGDKQYSDGSLWYRVPRLNAEEVLERIAEQFPEKAVAEAGTRDEKIAALSEILARHGDLLIGLDEVADSSVAQAVLQAAGNCAVILNGSGPLGLAGRTTERRLKPLSHSLAVQLFKSLAEPASEPLSTKDEILVAKVCRRMRYLPLAVKLAALKFAEGTESLGSLCERLEAEPESLDDVHDGVAAIFNAHYQDLQQTPTAWQILVRVASMPASEAPEEALRNGQPDYFGAKDRLVNLGLVDYIGPGRLALHPLLGKQVQRVEPEAIAAEREWAAQWLTGYTARNRDDYNALESERANLLALLDRYTDERRWDDLVAVLRNLFDYLRVRGQWQEAFERLDVVVTAADQVLQPWNRAWAHLHRGIMYALRAEYGPAGADFHQADRMFVQVEDEASRGQTLYHRATVWIALGRLNQARDQLDLAITLMGDAAAPADRAGAHERLADLLVTQGQLEAAQPHFEAALTLGDTEKQARAHIALGQLARHQGNNEEAQAHLVAAAQLVEAISDVLTQGLLYGQLGYIYYYQGRYDEALGAFEQSGTIFEDLKYQPGLAQVRHSLGNVALAHGQLDQAARLYRAALEINEARGLAGNAAYNQYQLSVIAQRQQQYDDARDIYQAVSRTAANMGDVGLQGAVQHQLTSLAPATGDIDGAREHNREATRLAEQASDALAKTSALYYRGLLELRAGDLEAGRQTLAQVHASFAALNSPEAEKVATLLAGLGAEEGEIPVGLLAGASQIDVTKDSGRDAVPPIDRVLVTKDSGRATVSPIDRALVTKDSGRDTVSPIDRVLDAAPWVDVVKAVQCVEASGKFTGLKIDSLG